MVRIKMSIAATAVAFAVLAPGSASAASAKPGVSTGKAAAVQQTTATLRGAVRPNGAATTYYFQLGTTHRKEIRTAETPAGSGGKLLNVTAPLTGLAPATRYFYRLVARNRNGTTRGKERSLTTKKQPLGLVLGSDANPVAVDQPLTLAGRLSGTDGGGRQVTLQYKPFPYTADWTSVPGVNDIVTDPGGVFAFRLPAVAFNTQFRVALPSKASIVSPIVAIGVKPRISTKAPRTVRRSGKRKRFATIRWSGTITPNRNGSQVLIQKLVHRTWTTIGATTARGGSGTTSSYAKRLRQRHGGSYRVLVNPIDGAFVANVGRTHRVRVKRAR